MAMIDFSKVVFSRRNFLTLSGFAAAAVAAGCVSRRRNLVDSAAKIESKHQLPVLVIGAGLGSLTTAAYLAKSGFPVTVVEQHHIPGGYATSFERGRFTFEVSLHASAFKGSSTERALIELDLVDRVEAVKLPDLCRIVTPDFDITLPQTDPKGCVRVLSEHFPKEEQGIRGFIDEIIGVADEVCRLPDKIRIWDKLTFGFRYPYLWNIRDVTLAQLADKHVEDARLKSFLTVFWNYYGLPPSELSGFYYAVATGLYVKGGAYCYKPRSQALSNALSEVIENSGGKIIYQEEVSQILVEDKSVVGVRLQGGEKLSARAVISGASGPSTFGKLLPPEVVPPDYRNKLANYRPSVSSFVVWLGLNRDITDRISSYEIFLHDSYDHDIAHRAQQHSDATKASLGITVFDNAFKGYSVPGTSTVTIMFTSGYEPWKRFEADYFADRKDDYNREKERIARIMIKRAEKLIPGLSDMVEVKEIATPLTNLRFTKNPGGAIYGFEQAMGNTYLNRIENRTPINGLYLAGAWGSPGGGFTGAQRSGITAFKNFVEDFG
ncbi:MAG: NAD(P)/FAD-dependent oxidoreductase [Proteobacteria bacterium]|nr:NAD(P)/FAD-dependent oxidoreductase [Pseudomonadota bacterium]